MIIKCLLCREIHTSLFFMQLIQTPNNGNWRSDRLDKVSVTKISNGGYNIKDSFIYDIELI